MILSVQIYNLSEVASAVVSVFAERSERKEIELGGEFLLLNCVLHPCVWYACCGLFC